MNDIDTLLGQLRATDDDLRPGALDGRVFARVAELRHGRQAVRRGGAVAALALVAGVGMGVVPEEAGSAAAMASLVAPPALAPSTLFDGVTG